MSACRGGCDSAETLKIHEGSEAEAKPKGKDSAGQAISLSQASTDISTSQVIEAVNESRDFIDQRLGEAHNELKNDIEAAARVGRSSRGSCSSSGPTGDCRGGHG
ncbi:hypothetical protein FOZ62_015035 [Perkinsus olseni]|uniref:Uncharacterized protein n=1 Tax=Perkinsus olseni TaxID=32597 RepID=A0A7J6SHL9_PEROL|nr:hypothetical protein FOZ62_015035 [Perkinsus olseni]